MRVRHLQIVKNTALTISVQLAGGAYRQHWLAGVLLVRAERARWAPIREGHRGIVVAEWKLVSSAAFPIAKGR